jgi:hypothetical protein
MELIKTMLGDAAANHTDAQILLALEEAQMECETYCRRQLDKELEHAARKMAVVKLNRVGTEGLAATGFSGVSESYIDGYPADIMAILNRKRKVKVL